jgi:hypothetical protein
MSPDLEKAIANLKGLTEGDFDTLDAMAVKLGTGIGALRGVSNDLAAALDRWGDVMDEGLRKELERLRDYAGEISKRLETRVG